MKTDSIDNIIAYLSHNGDVTELSSSDRLIFERIQFAYEQLKIEMPCNVVKRIMLKYKVSQRTAYNDIENAQKIFGERNKVSTDFLESFIIDNLKQIVNTSKSNTKAKNTALGNLIKMYQIITARNKGIDISMLGNNTYNVLIVNGKSQKEIDIKEIPQMSLEERQRMAQFVFADITEETAKEILES